MSLIHLQLDCFFAVLGTRNSVPLSITGLFFVSRFIEVDIDRAALGFLFNITAAAWWKQLATLLYKTMAFVDGNGIYNIIIDVYT